MCCISPALLSQRPLLQISPVGKKELLDALGPRDNESENALENYVQFVNILADSDGWQVSKGIAFDLSTNLLRGQDAPQESPLQTAVRFATVVPLEQGPHFFKRDRH